MGFKVLKLAALTDIFLDNITPKTQSDEFSKNHPVRPLLTVILQVHDSLRWPMWEKAEKVKYTVHTTGISN